MTIAALDDPHLKSDRRLTIWGMVDGSIVILFLQKLVHVEVLFVDLPDNLLNSRSG